MQGDVQVTFRNMPVADTIERRCWEEAEKLERYFDRITACRVVIEKPHRRHRKGDHFLVRVGLTVPGSEIVINREPPAHDAHEDVRLALREAFDAARRKLEDYVRRMRGQVKPHETGPHAVVARIVPDEGFGFLRGKDGREIYFHRNSVIRGGFAELAAGDVVTFHEEEGEKGPQASSVILAERQSPAAGAVMPE